MHLFKSYWTMHSKFIYYSKFNTKHNWGGGQYNHFNEHEKFLLDNILDIHMSFKNNEASAYGRNSRGVHCILCLRITCVHDPS